MTADDLHFGVRLFAIINFAVIGVSHILAPRAWAEYFILLQGQGRAGVFTVAFATLAFGSIIAAFHNVWAWPWLLLTLLGWAQVLKAFVYFAFPAFGLKQFGTVSVERAWMFAIGGLFLLGGAGFFVALLFGL